MTTTVMGPHGPNGNTDFDPVAYMGVPVMTTEMLAKAFGTDEARIRQNFANNKARFTEGAHFFKVTGKALADLRVAFSDSQISNMVRSLILWTEKGAARHAKILDTDEAWAVYEQLEDTYFAVREAVQLAGMNPKDMVAALNAINRLVSTTFRLLPGLGARARQSMVANATELVLGRALVPVPVVEERFWTTTEVAAEAGVRATVAGRVANVHCLKTPDNGESRLSQSQNGPKQVEQWYWTAKGRAELLSALRGPSH